MNLYENKKQEAMMIKHQLDQYKHKKQEDLMVDRSEKKMKNEDIRHQLAK